MELRSRFALVSALMLLVGIGRLIRIGDILDLVAGARHQAARTFRPQCRYDASCSATPIEASQNGLPNFQRVKQFKQIHA